MKRPHSLRTLIIIIIPIIVSSSLNQIIVSSSLNERSAAYSPLQSDDIRLTSYTEFHLDLSTKLFSSSDVRDFENIVFDHQNHQIITGTRNFILRLDLRNLTLTEKVEWSSSEDTKSICQLKGQSESECENYVKVLHIVNDRILACGTNAHSPICTWRYKDSPSTVLESFSGAGKCPTGPRQNSTFTMTSNGDLYSAAVTDFAGRDSAIYRSIGPSRPLRTSKHNSKWLNEPDFISSFEIGDFIYFFFREVAIEYINCGKAVYSRVARICKNDKGGRVVFEDNWTSFVKARLNCSIPGKYPFYYNELQATHFDVSHGLLYAVFTTPVTSIYGSAICVYNVSALESVFSGDYKYQENSQSAWMKVKKSWPQSKCGGVEKKFAGLVNHHLIDVHLMDEALQPATSSPIIVVDNTRYTHVAVDTAHVIYKSALTKVKVIYATTLEGALHKYVVLPGSAEEEGPDAGKQSSPNSVFDYMRMPDNFTSCLVEVIEILAPGLSDRINYVKLEENSGDLFVGTSTRLYRIPKHRCHRHKTKRTCENGQDPYCNWDEMESKCSMGQLANLSSCPIVTSPDEATAEWSDWSEWQTCNSSATHPKSTTIECNCRYRTCNGGNRGNGGGGNHGNDGRSNCRGPAVEIANCTAIYESEWMLSDWGEWSECSTACGGGQQKRSRTCIRLASDYRQDADAYESCPEAKVEYRFCNKKCKDTSTPWSRWYSTVETAEGKTEDRLRCVCRSESKDVCRSELQIDSLYCSRNTSNSNNSKTNCRIAGKSKRYDEEVNAKSFMLKVNKSVAHLRTTSCYKRLEESDAENEMLRKKLTEQQQRGDGNTKGDKAKRMVKQPVQSADLEAFRNYCGCRDLGLFRVCYKCSSNAKRLH